MTTTETTAPQQITARELRETDTIVMNPAARPAHVIHSEIVGAITRQKYGVTFQEHSYRDGQPDGGLCRRAFRYTDKLWVRR